MRSYDIGVELTKATRECRICRKKIYPRDLCFFGVVSADYQMTPTNIYTHPECMVKKIIGDISKIRTSQLKKENDKMRKIGEIL